MPARTANTRPAARPRETRRPGSPDSAGRDSRHVTSVVTREKTDHQREMQREVRAYTY
jgi:hypothetical protein